MYPRLGLALLVFALTALPRTAIALEPLVLTDAVIMRCLAREPVNRFQRIADVGDNLERIAFRTDCAWRETVPMPRPSAARVDTV